MFVVIFLYNLFSYCSVSDAILQQLGAWRNEAADIPVSTKQSSWWHSDSGKICPPFNN